MTRILSVLSHPQISGEQKLNVLENAFKGKISDEILGLFAISLRKNREALIVDMLKIFIRKAGNYKGIETAFVTSAKPLSENQIENIKQKLSKNLNKQILFRLMLTIPLLVGFVLGSLVILLTVLLKNISQTLKNNS